jgi:hypothetical protein
MKMLHSDSLAPIPPAWVSFVTDALFRPSSLYPSADSRTCFSSSFLSPGTRIVFTGDEAAPVCLRSSEYARVNVRGTRQQD